MPTEPPKQAGNGWLIAGAALLIGYLLGQESGPSTTSYTETAPPPIITPTSSSDTRTADHASTKTLEDVTAIDTETPDELSEEAAPEGDETDYAATSYGYAPRYAATTTTEEAENPYAQFATTSGGDLATATETTATASGPWTGYLSDPPVPTYQPPALAYTYTPPKTTYRSGPACAENGSCYGDIAATGRPKTVHVGGYFRKDGTYVRGHYRSKPKGW